MSSRMIGDYRSKCVHGNYELLLPNTAVSLTLSLLLETSFKKKKIYFTFLKTYPTCGERDIDVTTSLQYFFLGASICPDLSGPEFQ